MTLKFDTYLLVLLEIDKLASIILQYVRDLIHKEPLLPSQILLFYAHPLEGQSFWPQISTRLFSALHDIRLQNFLGRGELRGRKYPLSNLQNNYVATHTEEELS